MAMDDVANGRVTSYDSVDDFFAEMRAEVEDEAQNEHKTISFKEGDIHIIYSPSLDISGYGYTEAEAKRSFEIVCGEHLRFSEED